MLARVQRKKRLERERQGSRRRNVKQPELQHVVAHGSNTNKQPANNGRIRKINLRLGSPPRAKEELQSTASESSLSNSIISGVQGKVVTVPSPTRVNDDSPPGTIQRGPSNELFASGARRSNICREWSGRSKSVLEMARWQSNTCTKRKDASPSLLGISREGEEDDCLNVNNSSLTTTPSQLPLLSSPGRQSRTNNVDDELSQLMSELTQKHNNTTTTDSAISSVAFAPVPVSSTATAASKSTNSSMHLRRQGKTTASAINDDDSFLSYLCVFLDSACAPVCGAKERKPDP